MDLFNRIDNPSRINKGFIDGELNKGNRIVLQFSKKIYTDKLLGEINELCGQSDSNLTVRFYGFYNDVFDCRTVEKLPNVKSLSIDGLTDAVHVESIKKLEHLERLSIGVYNLKETELLASDNFKKLKELLISQSKTKAFNLEYLGNYKNLSRLGIVGHTKNIAVVGKLKNLEILSLNSISKVSIDFVNKLSKLKELNFVLGGRENLDELEENEIEALRIIRVRGFSSFSNLSKFKGLKNLTVEDQIRLTELKIDEPQENLETLKLINCKNLAAIDHLANLTSLKTLRIFLTSIDFDDFINRKFPESLEKFAFFTGKSKLDKKNQKILSDKGYDAR